MLHGSAPNQDMELIPLGAVLKMTFHDGHGTWARGAIEAFRHLPGVEIVPSRVFKTWLPKQVKERGMGSGLAS